MRELRVVAVRRARGKAHDEDAEAGGEGFLAPTGGGRSWGGAGLGGRARRGEHGSGGNCDRCGLLDGGGIYDFSGPAALRATTVANNVRDNCFPAGSVAGCSGLGFRDIVGFVG